MVLKLPKATCMSRAFARNGHEGGLQGKAVYPASEAARAGRQAASQPGGPLALLGCLLHGCLGVFFAANCHCLLLACLPACLPDGVDA